MKAFSKNNDPLGCGRRLGLLTSCEMEYYKEELYRKEIFIVSGENNILGEEFEYGENGFTGNLPIYASGSTGLDEDVTVKFCLDDEAIGGIQQAQLRHELRRLRHRARPEYYTIDPMSVDMKAGSYSTLLPINVRIDNLLPDETYFIPLRIESVSGYMASTSKNYVLFEILRKNEYATTKSDTYYTMTGTTQTGWVIDGLFGSDSRRQSINSSKLVIPIGKHSIRILPGATAASDKLSIRNNSLRVTVDPETWVNVPRLRRG